MLMKIKKNGCARGSGIIYARGLPNRSQVCQSAIFGILGAFGFLYLFPGSAITTAMHPVLKLPGPGAGIGLIFGPFIILLSLIVYNFNQIKGTIIITSTAFGIVHSIFTPLIYPSVITVGSLGPTPLRIAAVILLAVVLEIFIHIFEDLNALARYLISAGISNIACLVFYWVLIFPGPKGWVNVEDIPVLLGIAILSGTVVGGAVPFALRKLLGPND